MLNFGPYLEEQSNLRRISWTRGSRRSGLAQGTTGTVSCGSGRSVFGCSTPDQFKKRRGIKAEGICLWYFRRYALGHLLTSAWLTDGGHLGLGPVEGDAVEGGGGPWGVWGAAGLGTHGRPTYTNIQTSK